MTPNRFRRIRASMVHAGAAAVFFAASCATAFAQNDRPLLRPDQPINLLQPLDDGNPTISAGPNIQIFFTYFNRAWPWILGTAAGIAVLQALIGGIQVMMSGGDSGARGNGINRLKFAIAGLLLIGLSGMILETINPLFYQQV